MHLEKCTDCHTIPPAGLNRFLVKNSETRESIHVLAATSQEVAAKTGWSNPLFTLMVETGSPPEDDKKLAMKGHGAARLLAMRKEKEESFEELQNEKNAFGVTNSPIRSASGQKETNMATKKKTASGPSTIFDRAACKVLRRLACDGYTFKQIRYVVGKLCAGKRVPADGTIKSCIRTSKDVDDPAFTGEQQQQIESILKQMPEKMEVKKTETAKPKKAKSTKAKKTPKLSATKKGNKKRVMIPQQPPKDGVGVSDKAA